MTTELTQKLENIISGHSINEDDADWLRALTQRPAAQAGEVKCQTCNGHGLVGGHMQDGSGYGEGCPDCNPEPAPLVKWASTQPGAQTEREAFEAWWPTVGQTIGKVAAWEAWHARAMHTPQQATPASAPQSLLMRLAGIAAECSDPDTTDALDALIAATQQATPTTSGNILTDAFNEVQALKQQATPEPVGEPIAFVNWPLRGGPRLVWYSNKALQDAILKSREGHISDMLLYTHPAPGVPEGFALVPVKATPEMVRAGSDAGIMGMTRSGASLVYAAMLAAAQAKGGE